MKHHKIICLIIYGILFVKFASAQQVSLDEAVQAAINTIRYEYKGNNNRYIDTVFTKTNNSDTLLYEVMFDDGNIVLLSGNKACIPILGIILFESSDTTSINGVPDTISMFAQSDLIPDGLKDFIMEYEQHVNYCFRNNLEGYYAQLWQDLQTFDTLLLRESAERGPFIGTFWGQSESNDRWLWDRDPYAYNTYIAGTVIGCPKCYTGCGATALAQIMNVWKHPQEIPYRDIQLDWNNMASSLLLKNNSNYLVEKNAIGRLLQQCGREMDMIYCAREGYCASLSYFDSTYKALKQFGYGEIIAERRDTNTNWTSMLIEELDNNRPLYYRASEYNGHNGHAFICDGYKSRPLLGGYKFHFNWGWNGRKNGWFVIDRLNPGYSFNYNHKAIINIYPTNCFQNVIMECVRIFTSGIMKEYSVVSKFSNNGYGFYIYNSANINIYAGDEILLTDGFCAQPGSVFQATITPCSTLATFSPDYFADGTDDNPPADSLSSPKSLQQPAPFADDATLKVFPNPTDNLLNVELSGAEIKSVVLYDLQGRVVETLRATSLQGTATATLIVRNVPAGVYLLRVTDTERRSYARKVTIR